MAPDIRVHDAFIEFRVKLHTQRTGSESDGVVRLMGISCQHDRTCRHRQYRLVVGYVGKKRVRQIVKKRVRRCLSVSHDFYGANLPSPGMIDDLATKSMGQHLMAEANTKHWNLLFDHLGRPL